ncbi:TIGR02281 family clan AA aspartic protease [Acuticoccus sp. M5D2P5]|uniref:retropepsin-like aspartic protease family protein n=1 Tax=Acuticoccus kalidii TaxID=2910977 RepID=UPI001F209A21|nr:TIGR02281 family clan AA aspartic protease [Acuticoccus kalidii]MCF3935620.1 TIGR02281 family clan AA aspartic protease [Acuticoccus kalidii]
MRNTLPVTPQTAFAVLTRLVAGFGVLACFAGTAFAQSVPPIEIDNTAPRMVKLIILLIVFLVILFGMRRIGIPHIIRSAAIWLVAILALVALYGYRGPIEMAGREMVAVLVPGVAVNQGGNVIVHRSYGGHFVLDGAVDGAPVRFLFDTGASTVVLSSEDAARAGFDVDQLDFRIPVTTASGMTEVAPVRLGEIQIGDIRVNDVRAAVAKPHDLDHSLLGMTFLNRLDGYEVRRDRLVLNP